MLKQLPDRDEVTLRLRHLLAFHLEEAVRLLQQFFRKAGSDAVCEIIPGRDHYNLYQPCAAYPDGLDARIDREMNAAYRRLHGSGKGN